MMDMSNIKGEHDFSRFKKWVMLNLFILYIRLTLNILKASCGYFIERIQILSWK